MADRPLRVLYLTPYADLGGAERAVLDLATLHDPKAVEPAVCFLHDGPLVSRWREELGIQTFLVPAPRLRHVVKKRHTVAALTSLLLAQQVDLVHSTMGWAHLFGGPAARRARKPAVWWQHTAPTRTLLDLRAAIAPTRAIIANSAYTATAQGQVNPLRRQVVVIYPGTRIPTEERAARRQRGRSALGVEADEFAVGIAGRLQRWKGQDVVLRAAASLLRARPRSRLFVIGGALFGFDGEWEQELRRLAAELGIEGRVVFTGHRDDMTDCLAALDVAVHASVNPEPFGLALVEAMAAGTALVAADGGAAREIVTHDSDGLLVPRGDHEALAVALLTLHDHPERRAQLAAAAEWTASVRFDATLMARQMEALYRSLLGR